MGYFWKPNGKRNLVLYVIGVKLVFKKLFCVIAIIAICILYNKSTENKIEIRIC